MQRYGSVIGLGEEGKAEYKRLHAAVWSGVLAKLREVNVTNYSIFLKEPENLMFSYFEYTGSDFAADMAKMAADPENPTLVGGMYAIATPTGQSQGW